MIFLKKSLEVPWEKRSARFFNLVLQSLEEKCVREGIFSSILLAFQTQAAPRWQVTGDAKDRGGWRLSELKQHFR